MGCEEIFKGCIYNLSFFNHHSFFKECISQHHKRNNAYKKTKVKVFVIYNKKKSFLTLFFIYLFTFDYIIIILYSYRNTSLPLHASTSHLSHDLELIICEVECLMVNLIIYVIIILIISFTNLKIVCLCFKRNSMKGGYAGKVKY